MLSKQDKQFTPLYYLGNTLNLFYVSSILFQFKVETKGLISSIHLVLVTFGLWLR